MKLWAGGSLHELERIAMAKVAFKKRDVRLNSLDRDGPFQLEKWCGAEISSE